MLDVVGEMRHLCGLDVSKSPVAPKKSARGYDPRSVSPVGKGKTWNDSTPVTVVDVVMMDGVSVDQWWS